MRRMPLYSELAEFTHLLPMGHLDLLVERVVGDGGHAPVSEELRSKLIIFRPRSSSSCVRISVGGQKGGRIAYKTGLRGL